MPHGFTADIMPAGYYGEEYLGPVHRIRGKGCIVTKFSVFLSFPIFPLGTYFLIDRRTKTAYHSGFGLSDSIFATSTGAIPVAFSGLSLLLGYLQGVVRTILMISSLFLLTSVLMLIIEGRYYEGMNVIQILIKSAVATPISVGVFLLSNHISRASPRREEDILKELNRITADDVRS